MNKHSFSNIDKSGRSLNMNVPPKAKPIRTYSKNSKLVSKRRKDIIRNATHILTKRGFHGVSMREIAEACNMPIGTLYRYIGSKNDILYLVIDDFGSRTGTFHKQVLGKLGETTPTQALEWAVREFCRYVDQYRYLLVLSWREIRNLDRQYREPVLAGEVSIIGAFEEILRKGCEADEFTVHSIPVVANDIVVLAELWALRHWFLKDKSSLDEFIEQQVQFTCHGICKEG